MRIAVLLMLVTGALAHAEETTPAAYGFALNGRIWVELGKSVRADLTEVDAINSENGKHMRLLVKGADAEKKSEWVSTATYQFKGAVDDSAQLIVLFAAPPGTTVHSCSTSEALWLTAWSGPWKKKSSRRLWQSYWALDMDVEANCTDREMK